ncbi:MAG TPA: hypothetical protein VGQ83_27655, partial [Polyangia bacterium]
MIFGGAKRYFCGAEHKAAFAADPARYAGDAPVAPAVPPPPAAPEKPAPVKLPKLVLHETSQPTVVPSKLRLTPLRSQQHPTGAALRAPAMSPATLARAARPIAAAAGEPAAAPALLAAARESGRLPAAAPDGVADAAPDGVADAAPAAPAPAPAAPAAPGERLLFDIGGMTC